jgi:hypothetical protein
MPGDYHVGLVVYPCVSYPDGSVGYCGSVEYVKEAFTAEKRGVQPFARRAAGEAGIRLSLRGIVQTLKDIGVEIEFDEAAAERIVTDKVGAPPPSPEV